MTAWIEEEPTMELRILNGVLQQKWKVTKGGNGTGVDYTEEWRNVPTVEKQDDFGDE